MQLWRINAEAGHTHLLIHRLVLGVEYPGIQPRRVLHPTRFDLKSRNDSANPAPGLSLDSVHRQSRDSARDLSAHLQLARTLRLWIGRDSGAGYSLKRTSSKMGGTELPPVAHEHKTRCTTISKRRGSRCPATRSDSRSRANAARSDAGRRSSSQRSRSQRSRFREDCDRIGESVTEAAR